VSGGTSSGALEALAQLRPPSLWLESWMQVLPVESRRPLFQGVPASVFIGGVTCFSKSPVLPPSDCTPGVEQEPRGGSWL